MRNYKGFLAALLAVCLLVSASCDGKPSGDMTSSEAVPQPTSSPVSDGESAPPTEPPAEDQGALWPDKTQLVTPLDLSSRFTSLGEDVYRLDDGIDLPEVDLDHAELNLCGNTLLVTDHYYPEGDGLRGISLFTADLSDGTCSRRLSFADGEAFVYLLSEDRVAVAYGDPMCFEVYDRDLELVYQVCPGEEAYRYQNFSFSEDGSYLVYGTDRENILAVVDMKTGEVCRWVEADCAMTYSTYRDGAFWFLSGTGDTLDLFSLDSETWELSLVGNPRTYPSLDGLFCLGEEQTDLTVSPLVDVSMLAVLPELGDGYLLDYSDGCLMLSSFSEEDEPVLTAVDINGKVQYTLSRPTENEYPTAAISGNGFVVYVDGGRLLLWEYDKGEGRELDVRITTMEDLKQDIENHKNELKETYNVTVYSGGGGNDFLSDEYVAKISTDPMTIHSAMEILRDTLAMYPDGMIREMCTGEIRRIDIYLSGSLYTITEQGIDTAVGLTYTSNSTRVIVVDISYGLDDLAATVVHELMHIMDDKLLSMEQETGIPYLTAWDTFLPQGMNGYHNAYRDEYGREYSNRRYTRFNETDDNVYFIDAYSKTFATEDRARVMEYLMRGYWTEDETLVYGNHLLEKARYLCVILRDCFDSIGQGDVLPWEIYLNIDPTEFDYLLVAEEENRIA